VISYFRVAVGTTPVPKWSEQNQGEGMEGSKKIAPNWVWEFPKKFVLSMPLAVKRGDLELNHQLDHHRSTFHVSSTSGREVFVNWSWWKAMKCVVVSLKKVNSLVNTT
jgi:hypothetical protein